MPRIIISAFFSVLILLAATNDSHASVLAGDVNLDGVVSFNDIAPFVQVLASGVFQAEADTNFDGVVNFLDIATLFPPFFVGQ